jgi:2-amino-4-hydroxy-6-hydroxymethyldihydropteridine diphosphokinase
VLIHREQLALVALGANLPLDGAAPETTLSRALASLVANGVSPVAVSRFFRTPCFPAGAGPDYVNAACSVRIPAETSPHDMLALLHRIEDEFGRKRHFRWGMRTLDLDLIAFGDSVFPDAEMQTQWRNLPAADQARLAPDRLILPHPRLQDRAFVLIPLADVAPDWCHPLLGLTVAQMADRLDPADRAAIQPLPG